MKPSPTFREDKEPPFQRLLKLAGRLLGSQGLSVRELGGSTKAQIRRIQRDLNKLRECGLPLESTEHEESVPRYRLDNLRLAGSQLNLDETLAVTLAVSMVANTELGALARSGWDKLHYAVVNGKEKRSKTDLPALLSSSTGWNMPMKMVRSLSTALLESRRLRVSYQGLSDSQPRWRLIDPWQLFFQDRWYLRAWDPAAQMAKNFRTDRILECQLSEETFRLPDSQRGLTPHFHRWDLVDAPATEVVCQVDEKLARWLAENPVHPSQKLDGCLFRVSVKDVDSFLQWVCSLSHCQVLEPSPVRERLCQRVRHLLEMSQAVPEESHLAPAKPRADELD
jgi:predicted DNA-binding transcriptional regulator YafY